MHLNNTEKCSDKYSKFCYVVFYHSGEMTSLVFSIICCCKHVELQPSNFTTVSTFSQSRLKPLSPLFPHAYRFPDISPLLPSLSLPPPYLLPPLPQGWNYRKRHLIVYCAVMGNYGQHIMGEPHLRPLRLSALVIPRWIAAIPWRRLEVSTTIWQWSVVYCVVSVRVIFKAMCLYAPFPYFVNDEKYLINWIFRSMSLKKCDFALH